MAEYIEREAVIDLITRRYENPEICTQEINSIPAADVAPVVRCKDCKFHEDEEIGMVYCPNTIGGWIEEDWFCADGERKDGTDSDTNGSI